MKYDEIFDVVGDVGVYQGMVFMMLVCVSLISGDAFHMNFIGYTQEHWCKVPQLQNFSYAQQQNIAIPQNDATYDSCRMYNLNYSLYSEEEFIRWNRSVMVTNMTDTIECTDWEFNRNMFSQNMITRFNLVCGRSFLNQLVATIFFLGVFVGAVISGFVSDRFGRKKTILIFIFVKFSLGFLSIFPPNYAAQILGRFFMGVGTSGTYLGTYVLLSEMMGKTYRSLFGTMFQTLSAVATMIVAGLAYYIREDQWMQLSLQTPLVVAVAFIWVLPESPRWLVLKGRFEEAEKILKKMAAVNGKEWPKDFDISKIQAGGPNVKQKPCGAMMHYPRMRTRTCIIDFHWFVDSLMYYSVSLNARNLPGDVFVNMCILGAVDIPAGIICMGAVNWRRMGRRLTCCLALVIAGVCSFITIPMILINNDDGQRAFALIGKAFTTVAFFSIYLYSAEIFPTETRSSGMGTASMFARVSGMAAPYVGGPLANVWRPLPPLIFGVFGVAGGLATLALPETLGYKLCDTIEEAEAHTATRPYDEKKDKERIEEAAKEKEFANGKPDLPMSNEKDNKAYDMEMTYL